MIDTRLLLLLLAGFAGGIANALGGGGAFVVFPALIFAGVTPFIANATASLVLLPGGIAVAWVYRATLSQHKPGLVTNLLITSTIGALIGGGLLLRYPDAFSNLVPALLLIATLLFTFAPRLRSAATARAAASHSTTGLLLGQFAIGIYGGYFGAGMGVLALALYIAAAGMKIQDATGLRTVCNTLINLLVVALFAFKGAIDWQLGIPMVLSGSVAGYFAARIVHTLNENTVRKVILTYAWALTAWFFVRPLLA